MQRSAEDAGVCRGGEAFTRKIGSELAWRPALHLGGTFGLAFWKCYPATILPGNNSVHGMKARKSIFAGINIWV